jgi:hypothetical protein
MNLTLRLLEAFSISTQMIRFRIKHRLKHRNRLKHRLKHRHRHRLTIRFYQN